jgi:tetratricopeptide (TPR) repeat protein
MPQALADAVTALTQKKPDDAIRLARTFISQADAKGPGPDNTPPVMALAHEIVGTALAVQNKPDEAIAELQKSLAINPRQGSAMFKLGVIYREQNKLPEAKAALEKASTLISGDPVKLFLGDVNERLGDLPGAIAVFEPMLSGAQGLDFKFKVHLASLYDRVNRFDDTIKLLAPVVTVDSKDPEALMTLGFAYGGSGKPKEGIPFLQAAKALSPDNWRVDLALGTAQRETGDFNAAEASLQRAVTAEPKQPQARFQLAMAQMGKSEFQAAADTLAEAIKLAPAATELQQLRGDALFRAGKKDEAIAQFKELAARDGATVNDYVNLARLYQAIDRPDDAIQVYRDVERKIPPNPGVAALLAGVQTQQKKFADARQTIADARKQSPDDQRLLRALIQTEMTAGDSKAALSVAQHLVDVEPKNLEDRFALATLYGQLGDRKRAIAVYRAMLADAPDSAIVMNNLASALTDDGDAKGALPLAKRAQELAPKSAATADTLGWALLKSGQTKEALPLFESATRMAPNSPELLYHLGLAQKASNDPKSARANLEKALAISQTFDGSADAKAVLATLPK